MWVDGHALGANRCEPNSFLLNKLKIIHPQEETFNLLQSCQNTALAGTSIKNAFGCARCIVSSPGRHCRSSGCFPQLSHPPLSLMILERIIQMEILIDRVMFNSSLRGTRFEHSSDVNFWHFAFMPWCQAMGNFH